MRARSKAGLRTDSRIIADFNRTLLLVADQDSLKASVAARLQELLGPDLLLILALDPHGLSFLPDFSIGYRPAELEAARLDRRGPLARWLVVNETPLLA
jgi:hypothetical protein